MSNSIKILIVEDDHIIGPSIRKFIKAVFKDAVEVIIEGKFDKTEEILKDNRFELVILNGQITGGKGIDLLPRIMEETFVYFHSGDPPSVEEAEKKLKDRERAMWFEKPVNMQNILKLIEVILKE